MGGQAARPTFQLILPVAAPAASEPASAPSPTRNESFTTTWNWVTWLFSTTPSNSLTHTDWMLRIVRDARSAVCRTASSKLSEDRPDSSINFTTDIISSLDAKPTYGPPRPSERQLAHSLSRWLGVNEGGFIMAGPKSSSSDRKEARAV